MTLPRDPPTVSRFVNVGASGENFTLPASAVAEESFFAPAWIVWEPEPTLMLWVVVASAGAI